MKLPTQSQVIDDLEPRAIHAVDQVRATGAAAVRGLWREAKRDLRLLILHEYHRDFPGATWSLGLARAKGTLLRIERNNETILKRFTEESLSVAALAFRRVYRTAALRHAWILDQVTPESTTVKVPTKTGVAEAAVTVYTGADADLKWKERWNAWLGAYQSALNHNIRMNALNESSADDAAGEVDDTKAGSPAYDLEDALDRVYQYQALSSYSEALGDLADANPDMDVVEIWQTRYNARVCDDCDANRGLTVDDADGTIPLHPNCECYWRLVPKSFADLLADGDLSDQDLAEQLDALGVVPGGMAIRGDDGSVKAKAIISFERWLDGMKPVISGV